MANLLETKGGWLGRAEIDGTGSMMEDSAVVVEAVTSGKDGPIVAVYISAEAAVELHNVPALIRALQCALTPYGGSR